MKKSNITLSLDKKNVNVVIRLTATRNQTYTNVNNGNPVVKGYYEVTFVAPITGVKTPGYEIRRSEFNEKNLALYCNGNEVKTYTNGLKPFGSFKVEFNFLTKEQAKAAANTMRENKEMFLKMLETKKVNVEAIRTLVGGLPAEYYVENDAMGRKETYRKALNGNYYEALSYEAQKARGKFVGHGSIHSCRFNADLAEWLKHNINKVGIFNLMLKANEIYANSWGHYPKDDHEWIDDLCYELLVTIEDKAWLEFPDSEEAHNMLAYMSVAELSATQIFK